MTKMASHECSEGSIKSPVTNKVNMTSESKTDEEELTASPPVDRHDEPNDTAADAKENRTLKSTDDCTSVQTRDSDNTKNDNKDDLKPLAIDKNKQDDGKMDEKQETQNLASPADPENVEEEEEVKQEDSKDSSTKEGLVLKRKRKTLSKEYPGEESDNFWRKKMKTGHDRFCWRCHKEKVDMAYCRACSRSWHRKCLPGKPPLYSSLNTWVCGECANILKAENPETRSIAMAQLSIDQLCMLLKHVVERLRDYPGSEPFCKPVDLMEVPTYLDYVIKPMDLSLLESNVRSKLYGSTDAFMADAKWIQHNCIVFNTCGGVYADTSKLTNAAKQLIKVARQEISEIEACPDCYAHSRNLPRPQPSWFIEPCRRPHPLVWAKLKGFPFWPAKAMPRVNSQGYVDVRFFGEHDRAWVSPKDLFLYSEESPGAPPRKRKTDMDECVREITRHCRKLALMFGQFKFAPPKVQYDPNDPMQIQLMLPNYNPLEPNNPLPNPEFSTPQKKTPQKKRSSLKGKSQSDELTDSERDTDSKGDAHEKENEATSPKVQKLDADVKDTSSSQINLDDGPNKLNKKTDQESVKSTPQKVAQNKTVRGGKSRNARTSTSRLNVTDNDAENNSTSPNTSNSDKNNSQKAKNDVKSPTKSLPRFFEGESTSSDTATYYARMKRSRLKNIINPELALSQMDNSKVVTKQTKRVLKPKTRIVNKLNAEKELTTAAARSKENEKQSNSSKVISLLKNNEESSGVQKSTPEVDITLSPSTASNASKVISLLKNNEESSGVQKSTPKVDITLSPSTASNASVTHTIPSTNSIVPMADKSVLLLVVNGKAAESVKQVASTIDCQGNKDAQQGCPTKFSKTTEGQHNSPKKESKARKSFPRSSNSQNVQRPLPDASAIIQVSPARQEMSSTYELIPPEAGPISARLHRDAHDLARRMGHLMEETYKAAAQENVNGENGTADSYQATIFFLRMQIEHMKWQHQQQLAELKHNADRTLREMRASLEADRLRSVEEVRKEIEKEKIRCIEETKKKQWCAKCGQEAMFYCCWNTAYCNYPCQQSHWPTHMRTCSQQPAYTTIVSVANTNPQQSNNIVARDSTSKPYPLSPGKLSGILPSSASSLRNKTSQDTL